MKLLTIFALCLFGGVDHDPPAQPDLRIKPATTVRGLHVTIGDLCEITPMNDETFALSQIRFGPTPLNGYSRAVTRRDVIQALSAAGVALKSVKLSGGDEVLVQGVTVDVPKQDMLDAATAALQAQLNLEGGDVEVEPPVSVRRVQAPPGRVSQDLRARVRGVKTDLASTIVDVEILVDGEVFKKVPLRYKLQRFQRMLKTVGTIRKDEPLGPDNVVLVREPMSQVSNLYLTRMSQVMGMTASKTLRSNQLLAIGDVAPPAIIRKGDIVEVIMSRGRVKVTTRAIANEDAPLEGRIRLTNLKSRAPIVGVVHGPGIVVVN